jgi:hypothetical protein
MAQRAASFSKKPEAAAAAPRPPSEPPQPLPPVALDIAPLVAPYKSRGRVTLRIERMPQRARLSAGRNNGDSSWSLATDEIEGLQYFPPDGDTAPRVLSLRVLAVENGVPIGTMGLVDLPVGPEGAAAVRQKTETLDKLEGELSRVRTALNVQETKLATAAPKPSEDAAQAVKRALAEARAEWDTDLKARLAEAAAFAKEDQARAEARLRAEHEERVAALAAQAESDIADVRESWRSEAQAALAWKAAEEKRVAELEAQWREQLAAKSAADVEAAERATSARAETELRGLRQALSDVRTSLVERDSELAQLRVEARKESERFEQDRAAALAEAHAIWREAEAERAADLEKSLREEAEQGAVELRARSERAEASLLEARMDVSSRVGRAEADAAAARDSAEQRLSALTTQFAALNKTLATRDREISELRATGEAQRRDGERALSDALERAETAFREDEAARLAAAKTEWRREITRTEAGIEAERDATRTRFADETARLHEEIAGLRLNLSARDGELADVRADAERTRQDLEHKAQYDVRQAEKSWKSEEAARLAELKNRWRAQSSRELEEATRRFQEAETALAQQRAKLLALQQQGADGEFDPDHLRREIILLQSALATCERELAELRGNPAASAASAEVAPGAQIIPWPHSSRDGSGQSDEEPEVVVRRGLVREALALAAAVVIVIFTTPYWITLLPYDLQIEIANATGLVSIVPPPKPAAPKPAVAPAPPPVEHATVTHTVTLRADADASSKAVATVEKGDEVVVLAHQDKWAHIRLEQNSVTPPEGWVHAANLKE